jgi:diguanylate cyclase (GGDEF)-like protein
VPGASAVFTDEELHIVTIRALTEREVVFNARMVRGALTAPLAIALIAWIQLLGTNIQATGLWCAIMGVVEMAIISVGVLYARARDDRARRRLTLIQIILAGVVGLAWGSSLRFLTADAEAPMYMANLAVLAAVSGFSVVIMSPFRSASILYAIGVIAIPVFQLAFDPISVGPIIALALVVLVVVQLTYAFQVRTELTKSLDLAQRNQILVHQLEHARTELVAAFKALEAKNESLEDAVERLNTLAYQDYLTGAFSRRFIFDQLENQVQLKERHKSSAAIIIFDLDHFKSINDKYGHAIGDVALKATVAVAKSTLRVTDQIARYGGEEFMVLLPLTDAVSALRLAERLRQALEAMPIEAGGQIVHLTASLGVAELGYRETVALWVQRADAALYRAKHGGRNRVEAALAPTLVQDGPIG